MAAPAFCVDSELVISSRDEIGHGDGADILFNLDWLLAQRRPGIQRVVVNVRDGP
jgi:hypothetical protein